MRAPTVSAALATLTLGAAFVLAQDGEPPAAPTVADVTRAGELFRASCSTCHLPPDLAFEVDKAWLHQVFDTA